VTALVDIDVEHLEITQQGIIVTLPRSKTDPFGIGRRVGIPIVPGLACPVRAVLDWVKHAEIAHGPVFRPVNGHGAVLRVRLSPAAVSVVVKPAVSLVGRDAKDFSGHSLRAGFVTSAVMAGVSTAVIREQTGHSRESTLARYVRPERAFAVSLPAWLLYREPTAKLSVLPIEEGINPAMTCVDAK
jgi:integrase